MGLEALAELPGLSTPCTGHLLCHSILGRLLQEVGGAIGSCEREEEGKEQVTPSGVII